MHWSLRGQVHVSSATTPAPISVTSWRELLAAAAHEGTIVGADVMSSSGFLYPRSGYVTYLQADKQECNIAGRTVWLPNLVRLRYPDGRVYEHPVALAKHKKLMAEREAAKQEVQRLQSDDTFVPAGNQGLVRMVGELDATLNGRSIKTYAFTLPGKPHFVVLLGKSRADAERAMGILFSGVGYWDAVGVLVKAHLLWAQWHNMREFCGERAAAIRQGLPHVDDASPPGLAGPTGGVKRISAEDYGDWANNGDLESYLGLDFEGIFNWFDSKPTQLVTTFLTKGWDSNQFISGPDDDLDQTTLDAFMRVGLAQREVVRPPTVVEMLSEVSVADLRLWVKEVGGTLKGRSGPLLREYLIEAAPAFLEPRLRARQRGPRIQLCTPPGTTWRQFQVFRQTYRSMVETMQEWMYSGAVAPEADRFFRPPSKTVTP